MKHILTIIALSATLVSAGVLSTFEEKRRERENEKRVQFELEQMRIRANNGWGRDESLRESRATYGGSITGTVVDGEGNLVSSGYITLYDEYGHSYNSTSTNSSGNFQLSSIASGKYTIREGYNNSVWYGDVTDANGAIFFTVGTDETVILDPITQSTSTVTPVYDPTVVEGTVFLNGSPAANLRVNLNYIAANGDDWNHVGWITTDAEGKFSRSLNYVVHGEPYYCLITSDSITPIWIDGKSIAQDPSTFIFNADTVGGIVLSTTSGGRIKGKVTTGLTSDEDVNLYAIKSDGYEFGESYVNKSDSTFSFSGLPTGNYYLARKQSGGNAETYYPNGGTLDEAELISVTAGEETTVTMSVAPQTSISSKTMITFSITNSTNSQVNGCDFYIRFANGEGEWPNYTVSGGNIYSLLLPVDRDYTLEVRSGNELYTAHGEWSYTAGELTAGETSNETIVLPTAGRVAGLFPASSIDFNTSEFELEASVILTNSVDTVFGSAGVPFNDKYEVTGASAGTYSVSSIPYIEKQTAGHLQAQIIGFPAFNVEEAVAVIENTTTVLDLESIGEPVSGMISGTFPAEGSEVLFQIYAIALNGEVKSGGLAFFGDGDGNEEDGLLYKRLISRNWLVWNEVNSQINSGSMNSLDVPFDIPLLTEGDYYILTNWTYGDGSFIKSQWYGQNEAIESSWDINGQIMLSIPSDAKAVTVGTDNSWVKDINFAGSTPIIQGATVEGTGVRNFGVAGSTISLNYNFVASSAMMNVYSLNGRRVASRTVDVSTSALSWNPNLAAGSYLVEIVAGSERLAVQPIILQ